MGAPNESRTRHEGGRWQAVAGGAYGSILLGPAEQSPRQLRVRIQTLLTVLLVATNLIGAGIVFVLSTLVIPSPPLDKARSWHSPSAFRSTSASRSSSAPCGVRRGAACAALGDRGPDSQRRGTAQGARRPLVPDQDPGRPLARWNPRVHRSRLSSCNPSALSPPPSRWASHPSSSVASPTCSASSPCARSPHERCPERTGSGSRASAYAAGCCSSGRWAPAHPVTGLIVVAIMSLTLGEISLTKLAVVDARARWGDPGLRAAGHLAQRPRGRRPDPGGPQRAAAGRGG